MKGTSVRLAQDDVSNICWGKGGDDEKDILGSNGEHCILAGSQE
jgi:hypothetical protein